VAGIQFFCTKHLSVYTEIPLYFLYTNHKENIDNYEDEWEENYETYTYSFVTTDTKQTNTTKGKAFQLVLPVTMYLSLKF
jgi:hypothetical protein